MNDLLMEIITRICMIKDKLYDPRAIVLHPSRKDELMRCCMGNKDVWVDRFYAERPPELLSGDLTLYGVTVHFDFSVPKDEILVAYDPSPPLNIKKLEENRVAKGKVFSTVEELEKELDEGYLECYWTEEQIDDADDLCRILRKSLGKVFQEENAKESFGEYAYEVMDEALKKMACVGAEMYPKWIRELYYCEYCRKLVVNLKTHECEAGVH